MDWKQWCVGLMKKLKKIIILILKKIHLLNQRCIEYPRIMTLKDSEDMINFYGQIPANMLEFIGDTRYECGRKQSRLAAFFKFKRTRDR